uniref:Uncharacterized protein MANES_03G146000 n=1 Tax=Rhizophora mucronata TaxID=61149 RepID=A0A2P2K4J6_RHIMU
MKTKKLMMMNFWIFLLRSDLSHERRCLVFIFKAWEAKRSEDATLMKYLEKKSNKKCKKRPLLPLHNKDLEERFYSICQRSESSSLVHKDFCGKHIRFASSSSEDDDSTSGNEFASNDDGSHSRSSSQHVSGSDRVSSCPYPSATEEMSRLGLKGQVGGQSSVASGKQGHKQRNRPLRKKRKYGDVSCTPSAPSKILKGDSGKDSCQIQNGNRTEVCTLDEPDFLLSSNSLKTFITTWKDACKENTVAEVLETMLQFYKPTDSKTVNLQRKRIKSMFSSYPCIGLLNVAVASMKYGDISDSIYNSLQTITQHDLTNNLCVKDAEYESIDVEPDGGHISTFSDPSVQQTPSVTIKEILEKVTTYCKLGHEFQSNGRPLEENRINAVKKLCTCELWLVDQIGVKEFESLGYGDFIIFLRKHASMLPAHLRKLLACDIFQNSSLEIRMLQHQSIELVSQASNNLWENETITNQMISALIKRQFPLLSFEIMGNSSLEDFLKIVRKQRNNMISKCVLYSATLLGTDCIGDSLLHKEDYVTEATSLHAIAGQRMVVFESITSKDAIKVLLRAPMLIDLNLWSHWDLVFAPSLGPLTEWLLSEVNAQELLCLVTRNGKVIRIDHSATADAFLEAALQGSSFQTAVKLLSLFSLAGGRKHVPLSLLKCYSQHLFEVSLKRHFNDVDIQANWSHALHRKASEEVAIDNLKGELQGDSVRINQEVPIASRFILDCLGYLPLEFHAFAADVLLSGMQSVVKDAPLAILSKCNAKERLMLHEIGLSIGVMEWTNDYHAFSASDNIELFLSSGSSCWEATRSEFNTESKHMPSAVDKISCAGRGAVITPRKVAPYDHCTESGHRTDGLVASCTGIDNSSGKELPVIDKDNKAALIIESIRRDEFGLDLDLSNLENSMLKKQHARLGRALHCLSQELYSQDSHFLLELIQNADDNIYPENVEPTLTFILKESGVVVLNNELGFSAQNIRALCDVGNSTKKGSSAGYIGQKGIGFKSVFRITDAPEIHSNGFHIKFDIGEGQIGFVLPTVILPCNVDSFSRLLYGDTDHMDSQSWNTCIVLPFRSKFSEETATKMFFDLHPSLLLFLHRLHCIAFRNLLNDSLFVMRKEILEDGIVKISCGKERMTWLVASQKLQAHASHHKGQKTEISIAFTLEESDDGDYKPCLDQQPVFAFLPLRTYGLKFIVQGDFILPSSREEVDRNNPWNEWLLTKFPGLFVSSEKSFCSLSCFKDNPGKAVAAYMSFVPLVGEVHGFFFGLPKAIISELQRTACLLLEGDNNKMVPPCSVLRGWNEQTCCVLPDGILHEYLGLGFLDKNIVLSDSLARALGIEEYGPQILVRFMTKLCHMANGLKSMGLGWLSSWLNALYSMIFYSSGEASLIASLHHLPFIPLLDGSYSSVDAGTIWLHSEALSTDGGQGFAAFPNLYAKLRIVNPLLLSASSVDRTVVDNVCRMLHEIGVQQLSAHEIMKVNILPAIFDDKSINRDKNLLAEYLCFVMIHLQSSCPTCLFERKHLICELQNKAYILTNHGYKKLKEASIHFGKEFGNPINLDKIIDVGNVFWHEVDTAYLKHPANELISNGLKTWREFFQEIGVTDFVQVFQTEKCIANLSHKIFNNMMLEEEMISPGSIAKDWESPELVHLLSLLSKSGDGERCKCLLEILDTMWDDCFSTKATGYWHLVPSDCGRPFKSSFVRSICDTKWVASSMDHELHYPKDLFYDCDVVRSILGSSAPYVLPKVRSVDLLNNIGFKAKVTLFDALEILKVWRNSETPFKASIGQMSRLYKFILDELSAPDNKILEKLHSEPLIFVPYESGLRNEDLVPGVFLAAEELYWHDPTGFVDQMKDAHVQWRSPDMPQCPLNKTLCSFYPGLNDFFVNKCRVLDMPSCHSYLDMLQHLSTVALASQAASAVFRIFLKWSDGLKSGFLSSGDIFHLKECLGKLEYAVLPTAVDKWVSLHPSFGLVCWCDDEKLGKRFKHLDNIDFLYFGNLSDTEQEMLRTKVSVFLQTLGIPALSEVVTREAIHSGLVDSSFKSSLINWCLPYAQRYICSLHPDRYFELKQCGFGVIKQLRVVVVEKLFYRNVIKSCAVASNKQFDINCLLEGNTLYATSETDSHSLYLELSRLFFNGSPQLHLANFLHMITTMAEFGSTEEQTEFFIMNSQKVLRLPKEESVWSLSYISNAMEDDESIQTKIAPTSSNKQKSLNSKRKAKITVNWPPENWKNAPGFDYARANGLNTQPAVSQFPIGSPKVMDEDTKDDVMQTGDAVAIDIDADWTIERGTVVVTPDSENMDHNNVVCSFDDTVGLNVDSVLGSSRPGRRDQLNTGAADRSMQVVLTGRLGEQLAFKYFTEMFSNKVVRWVNANSETGLPYDIIIGEEESSREYIEVKATMSVRKEWFMISAREWQFAVEKGESFTIAHVLLGNDTARITTFKNPAQLCVQRKLQLVVMMPRQQ